MNKNERKMKKLKFRSELLITIGFGLSMFTLGAKIDTNIILIIIMSILSLISLGTGLFGLIKLDQMKEGDN